MAIHVGPAALPSHESAEEAIELLLDAWRLGLKSIAVYREGSKLQQPLTAT